MLLKYIAPGMFFTGGSSTRNPLELVIAMQAQKETQKANEYLKQIKVPWEISVDAMNNHHFSWVNQP